MSSKIAAVGHTTHDLYHSGLEPGGCAYYAAKVYAGLRADFELITEVGEDFELQSALDGLPHRVSRRGETTTFFNLERDDLPRLQLVAGLGSPIPSQNLPHPFIHLAPVLREIDLAAWVEANSHATIAINVQGWIKGAAEPIGYVDESWPPGLDAESRVVRQVKWEPGEELDAVDIACMSEEDLIDQGDLYERIRANVGRGCLTFGERGAMVWDGDEEWQVESIKVKVVDATGAGDTFAATFCAALADGRHVLEAGRRAAAAASVVIEDVGARALVGLSGELERRVSKSNAQSGG